VVHASGGPLNDIVVPYDDGPTGYHATSPETFAERIYEALSLSDDDDFAMRSRGRAWASHKFSREGFEEDWEASGWRQWLVKS
jgi:alpha-1,2-mannosyltransferase